MSPWLLILFRLVQEVLNLPPLAFWPEILVVFFFFCFLAKLSDFQVAFIMLFFDNVSAKGLRFLEGVRGHVSLRYFKNILTFVSAIAWVLKSL